MRSGHQQMQTRQFKATEDLNILRKIANDRNAWKNFTSLIYSVAQGKQWYNWKPTAQEREVIHLK